MGERMESETTVYNISDIRLSLRYFHKSSEQEEGVQEGEERGFYEHGGVDLLPHRRKRTVICLDQCVHVYGGGWLLLVLNLHHFQNNRGNDLILDMAPDDHPYPVDVVRCAFVHPGTNPNPNQWIQGNPWWWPRQKKKKSKVSILLPNLFLKIIVDNKSELLLSFEVSERICSCSYVVPSRGRTKICFTDVNVDDVVVMSGEEVLFVMSLDELYRNREKVLLLDVLDGRLWYDFVDSIPTTLASRIRDALPSNNSLAIMECPVKPLLPKDLKATVNNRTGFQLEFYGYHKIGNEARTEPNIYGVRTVAVPAHGRKTIRPGVILAEYDDWEFYKCAKFVKEIHVFGPKQVLLLVLSYREFQENTGKELQLTYNFMDDRLNYAFTYPVQTKNLAHRIWTWLAVS